MTSSTSVTQLDIFIASSPSWLAYSIWTYHTFSCFEDKAYGCNRRPQRSFEKQQYSWTWKTNCFGLCVNEEHQAITAKGHFFGFGWIRMLLFFEVIFGTLFGENIVDQKGNVGFGTAPYLMFARLERWFLSPILIVHTSKMIWAAFLLMAHLFVAMSTIGCRMWNLMYE